MSLIKTQAELLYREMLKEIDRNGQSLLSDGEKAESGFWIANDHYEKLKQLVRTTGFTDEETEINFFRNIKPAFTSQIEYLLILSEALLSVPKVKENAIDFWKEEIGRWERFTNRNHEFIGYYTGGQHDKDREYFLRIPEDWRPPGRPISFDNDPLFCSSHDHLVRSYLAHQQYKKYVEDRLGSLQQKKSS